MIMLKMDREQPIRIKMSTQVHPWVLKSPALVGHRTGRNCPLNNIIHRYIEIHEVTPIYSSEIKEKTELVIQSPDIPDFGQAPKETAPTLFASPTVHSPPPCYDLRLSVSLILI